VTRSIWRRFDQHDRRTKTFEGPMPDLRVVGLLGVLFLGTADARTPRHTRPEIQVPVSLSDRVKPVVAKAPGIAQPRVRADAVFSVEWMNRPIRSEQEQVLVELIANTSNSEVEEKADYLFRLSELYSAQQRFWRLEATELQIGSDTATDQSQKAKLRSAAAAGASRAKDYLLKAVKTFKALTDNQAFRNYPKMDLALFNYGYTLQSGKYMKEARAVFDSLLKNYPNSKFVPEAHLSFGDFFFESNQLADAEARYKMVLKFPKSAVYFYAMYKLGWIHLQQQRFVESLESFYNVVQGVKANHAQDALGHAAKLDFVRAYAEIGRADKAYPAFQRVDRDLALEMLEALGQLYVEQGKLDRAAQIHYELIRTTPGSGRACEWQYHVARGLLSAAGATNIDKVGRIEDLVGLYRSLASARTLPGPALQECRANAMAMSGEMARAYHNEALKTKTPETFGYAVRLYQAYVAGFPGDARHVEMQYLLAEALWAHAAHEPDARLQITRWTQASAAFAELARSDKTRAVMASRASVLAWMNAHDDGTLSSGAVPALTQGRPQPARPLSAEHQQLVDAIGAFAATTRDPRDPELGALRFVEANLYRRANHHDKAAAIYLGLISTHPAETFSEAAAALAIDSLVLLQRLDEMLLLADKLAADGRYLADKPDLAAIVKLVRSRSMRR
jgi:TolA-binding protein